MRTTITTENDEQLELIADLLRELSEKLDVMLNMLESIDHGVHN